MQYHILKVALGVGCCLASAACGTTPAPTETVASSSASPTPLVVVVTATLAQTTPSLTATTLPQPTATVATVASPTSAPSVAVGLTSDVVVAALKVLGLPVDNVVAATDATDPNKLLGRQNGYIARVSWHDTRLPAPQNPAMPETTEGGSVEVWTDNESAQTRFEHLQVLGKSATFLGDGYDFVNGPIVLRLSRGLTPSQADEYKKLLELVK